MGATKTDYLRQIETYVDASLKQLNSARTNLLTAHPTEMPQHITASKELHNFLSYKCVEVLREAETNEVDMRDVAKLVRPLLSTIDAHVSEVRELD